MPINLSDLNDAQSHRILAIDPGTTHSAWVEYVGGKIERRGYDENSVFLTRLYSFHYEVNFAVCEMIASQGMPVGKTTFETCLWIGRFMEAFNHGNEFLLVYRSNIKMHLCGSMRAKDGNIRQALIDRIGPQGTKKAPGPTYGISKHLWAALAVAVYAADCQRHLREIEGKSLDLGGAGV